MYFTELKTFDIFICLGVFFLNAETLFLWLMKEYEKNVKKLPQISMGSECLTPKVNETVHVYFTANLCHCLNSKWCYLTERLLFLVF